MWMLVSLVAQGALRQPLETCVAAQVEAEAWSHSACSAFTLLQVGLGRPHGGVVSHVVVGGEELHLLPE